jgi:hypothetical protein
MSGKTKQTLLNSVREGHSIYQTAEQDAMKANRRPLLKSLAVSVGTVLGLAGTASASGESKNLHDKARIAIKGYETQNGVERALQDHTTTLLETLSEEDYLSSTDMQIRGVKPHKAPDEVDPVEGTYVTAFEKEGQFTAHISIVRKTPSFVTRINVQPQAGNAFATVKTHEGEFITVVDQGVDDEMSTQKFCTTKETCPPSSCCVLCSKQQKHEKTCCTYSDGSSSCTEEPVNDCCNPSVCC